MNTSIGSIALIEIVSSLTTGVVILWLTHRILKIYAKRVIGLEGKPNMAYSLFMAAVLFSVGFSVSSVIQPLVSYFRIISGSSDSVFSLALSFIMYGGLYVTIAYMASLLITFIGIKLYVYLTPLNEFKEIKENNIGVAIVVSSIIVTINLISRSGVALLIESLLPYPELMPKGLG